MNSDLEMIYGQNMNAICPERPNAMETRELDIVHDFILASAQGKPALAASPMFTAEAIADVNQLISKTEGILVNSPLTEDHTRFLVRLGTLVD